MLNRLRKHWDDLRHGRPGHRFEARFETIKRGADRPLWGRVLSMLAAVVALGIGAVLMFIPGPAVLFFLVAGMLFAAESRTVARALDWTELKLRALLHWTKQTWKRLSLPIQVVLGGLVVLITLAGAYTVFQFFQG